VDTIPGYISIGVAQGLTIRFHDQTHSSRWRSTGPYDHLTRTSRDLSRRPAMVYLSAVLLTVLNLAFWVGILFTLPET
jgi:hypothetical protein